MGVKIKEWKGGIWLFIDHQGRRKAKRVGPKSAATDKAAELAAVKLRAALASGDGGFLAVEAGKAPVTFEDYATRWLREYAQQVCKPTTARFYEMNLRLYILPIIGSKAVEEITRADCRSLVSGLRDKGTLKPRSLAGVCRTLSSVLTHAVEDGHLNANPAFRLGRYIRRSDQKRAEIDPLTHEESVCLLEAAREHAPRAFPFFLCALSTGMRLGELLGLHWGDLDFKSRLIHVRRNLVGGVVTTPKNGKTRRVDMSDQLRRELRRLLTERKEEKLKKGWAEMPEWVFCTEEGGPLDGDNIRHRVFYRVLEKAELRRVRLHDLRHTFASLLLKNRESVVYVRDQLGHSSIQVTADTYGHLIPGDNRQAVNRLNYTARSARRRPNRRAERKPSAATVRNPAATEALRPVEAVAVSA